MAATLAGQPYAPEAVPQDDILELLDYDRHNQITFRSDAMLWGDVPGAAKVRFFHPGRYFKAPVRDQRAGGRHGAGDPVLARPFRHAEGQPGGQADECRLRRLRGDGPGRQERLDGCARRVLLPHLGLFGPVRHVGARAGDRQRRPRAGGVPALHALLAGAGAGGRDRHLRAAREPAGHGRLPDGDRPQERGVPGHRGGAVPARADDRPAGDRAADLDVLVRQEQPFRRAGLAAGDPRQRRAGDAARLRANGSGGR